MWLSVGADRILAERRNECMPNMMLPHETFATEVRIATTAVLTIDEADVHLCFIGIVTNTQSLA